MTEPPSRHPASGWLEPAPWRTGALRQQIEAGAFGSSRVQQWRAQLRRIEDDLIDLLASRSVIAKLQDIITRNPRLQNWNFFSERIFRWYATSTLVLVYRDLDRRGDAVSLWRLLDEMQRHSGELTRVAYRRLHSGRSDVPRQPHDERLLGEWLEADLLEQSYDDLSAGGDWLDVTIIRSELDELVAAAAEVKKVRHTVYAHRAAAGPALDTISLGTIHALVDIEERLVTKYLNVLFYESSLGLTPVDQTDWYEILTFPWILAERDTSVPYAATPAVVLKLFAALRPEERELVRKAIA
jgi:hypothetical protein